MNKSFEFSVPNYYAQHLHEKELRDLQWDDYKLYSTEIGCSNCSGNLTMVVYYYKGKKVGTCDLCMNLDCGCD